MGAKPPFPPILLEDIIMWKDISLIWQAAFAEGWEAFKSGSVPIGAAICDESGAIICTGRNRRGELTEGNRRIAHAETDCLNRLDTQKYPDFCGYTLYACMEPCPMCMGTLVMSGLRKLRVAARDGYCGAVHYRDISRYINSKNIAAVFEGGDMELVQLTMQIYYELRRVNESSSGRLVIESFAADRPQSLTIARELYDKKILDNYANKSADFGEVFDLIVGLQKG